MPQQDPKPGELYRHFKNKMYQIVAVATHSETREKYVVYQALYGDFGTYVRPYDMFISPVDNEKYPQVTQKWRFELVEKQNVCESVETVEEKLEENEEPGVNPSLLQFLDEDDWDKKYDILSSIGNDITDRLIDDFAACLDVVIPEGDTYDRYLQLKTCVRTRQRFETTRFR